MCADSHDSRFNRDMRLRRLRALGHEMADEELPPRRRDALLLEYAELAVRTLEEMIHEDECDEDARDELSADVAEWRARLEDIHVTAARKRVGIRWRGTAIADVELDGWAVAELVHQQSGWSLEPAGEELGLPSEWVAPPGLDGFAADRASRRALARVADHVARITPRPGDDSLLR